MDNIICSYGCGKEAKYFLKSGKGCCEKSPNSCEFKRKKDSLKKKGNFSGTPAWKINGFEYKPWNKGKIGEYSDEYRKKISESLIGKSKGVASLPEKEIERKKKISDTMRMNQLSGGLRKGSGRGKKGWYKGFWCDSSWELAWVIYNIDHNIYFERNIEGFEYIYNDKKRKYYPDFIVNGVYFEIKGRRNYEKLDNENKEKISQFNKILNVLYEKDMKKYLDYVIQKYGKDFIKLYN
jgi:hypothetical protein